LSCHHFLLGAVSKSHACFLPIKASSPADAPKASSTPYTGAKEASCYTGIRLETSLAVRSKVVQVVRGIGASEPGMLQVVLVLLLHVRPTLL
jgi:hypothetical protein